MAEAKANGRVTMALLGSKLDQIAFDLGEAKGDIRGLLKAEARQEDFNQAVRLQLWDDGCSRIQRTESTAATAMTYVRVVLVPIGLLIVAAAIAVLTK